MPILIHVNSSLATMTWNTGHEANGLSTQLTQCYGMRTAYAVSKYEVPEEDQTNLAQVNRRTNPNSLFSRFYYFNSISQFINQLIYSR